MSSESVVGKPVTFLFDWTYGSYKLDVRIEKVLNYCREVEFLNIDQFLKEDVDNGA